MFSFSEFSSKVCKKIECLAAETLCTEWRCYVDILDESHPQMVSHLLHKRETFWNSDKIGAKVRYYSDICPQDDEYEDIGGEIRRKEKYTAVYDPVQACWRELRTEIVLRTLPHWAKPQSLEEIFSSHVFCGALAYQWAISIVSENEPIAMKALYLASEMLDRCTGMIWMKFYADKDKKLSLKRAKAGSKGGRKKAEVYALIQEKLAKILFERGAKSGWKSKNAAVNEVIDPLWSFIQESKFIIDTSSKEHRIATMDQEALRDTILKQWSTKVDIVREAFEATVTRKQKKQR